MKSLQQKREEATARQEAYDALTTREKIFFADKAPGKSKKQLTKLHAKYYDECDGDEDRIENAE